MSTARLTPQPKKMAAKELKGHKEHEGITSWCCGPCHFSRQKSAPIEKTFGDSNPDDAANELLAQEGYDPQFGARPLKRAVQEQCPSLRHCGRRFNFIARAELPLGLAAQQRRPTKSPHERTALCGDRALPFNLRQSASSAAKYPAVSKLPCRPPSPIAGGRGLWRLWPSLPVFSSRAIV